MPFSRASPFRDIVSLEEYSSSSGLKLLHSELVSLLEQELRKSKDGGRIDVPINLKILI